MVKYSLGKENRDLRIKVKFDQNEDDKFDKHFSVNSPDLRRYRVCNTRVKTRKVKTFEVQCLTKFDSLVW